MGLSTTVLEEFRFECCLVLTKRAKFAVGSKETM